MPLLKWVFLLVENLEAVLHATYMSDIRRGNTATGIPAKRHDKTSV